ncbi:HK97 family phage prohead protease [Cellulosimicrobium cellulans]|uniref:HK97 family phage prohead protease n=1 Tax=Cellulosimicrobium cellulans TaxID=1710 RepID=UPI0036E5BCCE
MTVTLDRPTATGTSTTPPVRTVDVLCVPYGEVTYAVDIPGHKGEQFADDAFAHLVNAGPAHWGRIRLTDSHLDGEKRRPVARATFFTETEAGLFGTFRFFNTPEGRSAFENTREGTYGGVSIGFFNGQFRDLPGSIREVTRADLAHVSLVDLPAYDGAVIIGMTENGNDVPLTTTPRMVLPLRAATATKTSRPRHTAPRVTPSRDQLLIPPRTPAQIRADEDAKLQRDVKMEAMLHGRWNAKARVMLERARRRGASPAEQAETWRLFTDDIW